MIRSSVSQAVAAGLNSNAFVHWPILPEYRDLSNLGQLNWIFCRVVKWHNFCHTCGQYGLIFAVAWNLTDHKALQFVTLEHEFE